MRALFLLVPLMFLLTTAMTGFAVAAVPESEQRLVGDFTRVDLGGHGELTIVQGDTDTVTVEAEPRVMDKITTEVRNGTLYIRIRFGIWDWWRTLGAQPPRYTVSMVQVEGIELSGSGQIQGDGLRWTRSIWASAGPGRCRFRG